MDSIGAIIIAIIAFVIKIISDSNKKQEQNKKRQGQYRPSQKNNTGSSGSANPYPAREPYNYDRKENTDSINYQKPSTSDLSYRSLDPNLVPVDLPDVDYDKLTNVSVNPSAPPPLVVLERRDNAKLISVKSKLRQKDSFRELYLLSEILNKPKALRKWPRSIY